jgi:hypothetical protein
MPLEPIPNASLSLEDRVEEEWTGKPALLKIYPSLNMRKL